MNKKIKVVTIGEIMLGLRAPQQSTLEGAPFLECLLTGAESNVSIGLARLGIDSAWIGKMPDNDIARGLIAELRGLGVDTNRVVWTTEGRLGIMYIQLGDYPRVNQTIYDRKGSSGSELSLKEVDWAFIREASHLYLTGLTPSLSKKCLDVTKKAIKVAINANIPIFFDLNYRSTLWPSENKAAETFKNLIKNISILFITVDEAKILFNISGTTKEIATKLKNIFNSEIIVLSKGIEGSVVISKDKIYKKKVFPVTEINRIGVGDSFKAAFLYGIITAGIEKGLDYGAAMAAIKLKIPHVNYPLVKLKEIRNIVNQNYISKEDNIIVKQSHKVIR